MATSYADPTVLVTLKAFGDFLIAYRAVLNIIREMPDRYISLVAGQHVRPLAEALGVLPGLVTFIGGTSLTDVPAAFDVRRRGLIAATASLLKLRHEIQYVVRPAQVLIFESLGLREKVIAGRLPAHSLPAADNIYLAYDAFFGRELITTSDVLQLSNKNPFKAFIVPASRVARKILPVDVIADLYQQMQDNAVSARVLLLEGEVVDVPSQVPIYRIERKFSALISALKQADLVVSADSLPAHIGEFLERPTFVVSPTPNPYWLPRDAYLLGGHGVFDDLSRLKPWLDLQLYSNLQV